MELTPAPRPPRPTWPQLTLLAVALGSSACATVSREQQLADAARHDPGIRWPAEYDPADASFFVHNEIAIAAPPEAVWAVLMEAETWPEWYEGAADVRVTNRDDGRLGDGAVFTWTTMGLDFTSTILEFEPPYRLAWESEKSVIRGYHAWLVIETEGGCVLVTDESQHGFLTFFEKVFQPNKLRRLHDVWLAQIKARAEARVETTAEVTP